MARGLLDIVKDICKGNNKDWSADAVDGKISGLSNAELIICIDSAIWIQQQERMQELLATRRSK